MTALTNLRTTTRAYIKIDPNGKVIDNTSLDAFINRAYFQIQRDGGHKRRECQTNTTTNSTAGTQEYDLPSDFIRLGLVRYDGEDLAKDDKINIKRREATMTGGTPNRYYIYGTKLGLYPVPDATKVIDIDYVKRLPTITTSQASLLPSDFDDAIALFAGYLALKSISKVEAANGCLMDYKTIVSTLLNSYIFDDDNISWKYQRSNTGYIRSDVLYK